MEYRQTYYLSYLQENKVCENNTPSIFSGTTVIQHTGSHMSNHYSPSLSSSKETIPSLLKNISGRNITQLNELKLSNCIKMSDNAKPSSGMEEEEEEEEEEENDEEQEVQKNGYHKTHKPCAVDEDYDT